MHTHFRSFLAPFVCGWSLAAFAATAPPPNLLQNSGFEAGKTGWTTRFLTVASDLAYAHTGTWGVAETSCGFSFCLDTVGDGDFVRQLVPTAAGEQYELAFWARNYGGDGQVAVYWDGLPVQTVSVTAGPMAEYVVGGLVASGAGTLLELHLKNGTDPLALDDVSLTRQAPLLAVPEAHMAGMLLAGLGVLVLRTRRDRAPPLR